MATAGVLCGRTQRLCVCDCVFPSQRAWRVAGSEREQPGHSLSR